MRINNHGYTSSFAVLMFGYFIGAGINQSSDDVFNF